MENPMIELKAVLFISAAMFCFLICETAIAQTSSDSTFIHSRPTDNKESGISISDSISNFCGCESVESVKSCARCFYETSPVLKTGYQMSFETKTVVQGSCWGFVDAVFKKAGVTKETIFSSKEGGPYAKVDMLQPGDWIYHVNYSFRNVGHSAIFVCWKNKKLKQAITMSYVGMNRSVPGRLDFADIKCVYSIFRAKE
jgi:hypothetical protein